MFLIVNRKHNLKRLKITSPFTSPFYPMFSRLRSIIIKYITAVIKICLF